MADDGTQRAEETPTPRKRRWLRRTAWAMAAVALAVVVVPPLLPGAFVGRLVAGRLAAALAREVTVEAAHVSVFSGLDARGIAIRRRAGFGEGYLARVGRLRAAVDWASLVGGTIRLAAVEVEDADVSIVRNRQGELSIQDLLDRPATHVGLGRLAVRGSELRVGEVDGLLHSVLLTRLEVGPPVDDGGWHRRLACVFHRPEACATGEEVSLTGSVWLTPTRGEFDHAELKLAIRSATFEQLGKHTALDGDLEVFVHWDRTVRLKGTVKLLGLPAVPQMGFEGEGRAAVLALDAEWSPYNTHLELDLTTQPGDALHATASVKRIVADGTVPAMAVDNYVLAVALSARADLGRGGLPVTPLVGGRATLTASLDGTLAELKGKLVSTLEGGQVRLPNGSVAPLPRVALEADAEAAATKLSARLSRLSLETTGLSLTASGSARPAAGTAVQLLPSGLPPMAGEGMYGAKLDFAKCPASLRVLLGFPSDRPGEGAASAEGTLELAGDKLHHKLQFQIDAVPLDQGMELVARVPILNVVYALVGGRPKRLECVTNLRGSVAGEGWSLKQIVATLAGRGDLRLSSVRLGGSPLLDLLASVTQNPELRDLRFERADGPFTVAGERVETAVTLPYREGALVFAGVSRLSGPVNYVLRVKDPSGIGPVPEDVAAYLAAGNPLVIVSGTASEPVCRVPTESIVAFSLKRKLRRTLGN